MLLDLIVGIVAILAGAAIVRTSRLGAEMRAQRREIAKLGQRLDAAAALMQQLTAGAAGAASQSGQPEASQARTPASAPAAPPPVEAPSAAVRPPVGATGIAAEPSFASLRQDVEKRLTGRWTVWLGAVALALGSVFLVKYSIDQGWLGPGVRVALGLLLGSILVVLAQLARGEGQRLKTLAGKTGYVPPALAAAGVATLFSSVYAAFALYQLIPPLAAFVVMAGVAALAVLLSLFHGPFIAFLGLAGAFLVPLLVPSDHPSALGLFGYLLIVAAGCLMLVRYRGWWWLAQISLGLSSLWALAWLDVFWRAGDAPIVGIYLVLLAAGFIQLTRDPATPQETAGASNIAAATARTIRAVHVWTAAGLTSWLMALLAHVADDAFAALLCAGALVVVLLAVARREPDFDRLAWVAGGLSVLVIAGWAFSGRLAVPVNEASLPGRSWIPPGADAFTAAASSFALLIGGASYALQWGARRPWSWACAAAVTPIALLALVYWRIADVASLLPWGAVGLALAAVNLAAAWRSAEWRASEGMEAALAAYAVGTVGALALAATMSLREAWLSVALAVQLPAIGWIAEQTSVSALRRVSLAVAAAVLARLLLNPAIVDYRVGGGLIVNWLLYGYGLPCAAFLAAARLFRRTADDLLVLVLEGGGIALGLALVSLEVHQLLGDGTLRSTHYRLAEQGVQVSAWLAVALGLLYRSRDHHRPALVYGWKLIAAVAALHLVAFQLTVTNPLFTGEAVGETPVVNLLLLAYGVPAVLAVLIYREAVRRNELVAAACAGIGALAVGFVGLSLEVRQGFQGAVLARPRMADAEAYAYSLAWLLYGAALLGVGLYRRLAALRLAALAIITLTVAKAFLFDMSNLTGLYRAASFLALGLSLIGVGYLYQRVVFPSAPSASGANPSAP